jgi:hypothetical protein
MHTLSIIGKDSHTDEHVVGYYNTGDRMKYWGKPGAFWGGFWGLLFGSAFFAIPGLGPVLVAGPVVAWIVGALEGAVAVGGLSAIGAGLYGMGIPKDSVVQYETALKTDKFLLMVHGTAAEVEKAKDIIEGTRPLNVTLHSPEAVAAARDSAASSVPPEDKDMLRNTRAFERFRDPGYGRRAWNRRSVLFRR